MAVVDRTTLFGHLSSVLVGTLLGPLTANTIAIEPGRPAHAPNLSVRKGLNASIDDVEQAAPAPSHGSLVNLHNGEILVLSETEPTPEAFSKLLRDRVTNESVDVAPRLLTLLRELTTSSKPVRIELVSGYRSPKLNELLRKKGRNVSSASQHCLGHALDFRIDGMSSRQLVLAVEALQWRGGLAYYPDDADRFVHADVGPNRRWRGR